MTAQYHEMDTAEMSPFYSKVVQIPGFFAASSFIETMFYLPNRFRTMLLVNSNKIVFAETDKALLDLMVHMFYLNSNDAGG